MTSWEIVQGDCLDVLRQLPDDCIDAVVTDPPAGIDFMGKEWDSDRGGGEQWIAWLAERLQATFRVLKPGGHILVWALPRTSHRTAFAIEKAGYEIRDRHSHFFGTGFPKGGDISKQIDKSLGVTREVVGQNPNHRAISGVEYKGVYAGGNTGNALLTAATSLEAQQWEGWATALKPACEDWWLAWKPFRGPVYKNVLRYGTGALNIGAARIEYRSEEDKAGATPQGRCTSGTSERIAAKPSTENEERQAFERPEQKGRWPAHISFEHYDECVGRACVPECPVRQLDTQGGHSKSRQGKPRKSQKPGDGYGMTHTGAEYDDSGGPSRFFWCAKPTKREKNAGLSTSNRHPTVKGIDLMRYLVRLVCPPDGVVLDPFCGSGTTGIAARLEGMQFLGIEEDEASVGAARERVTHWEKHT